MYAFPLIQPPGCCSLAPVPCSLVLYLPAFTAADPLPALQPGALPQLTELEITLIYQPQPVQLPPSWGDPAAWPSLKLLKLVTAVVLPLPADWAHGFPALQELVLRSNVYNMNVSLATSTGGSEHTGQLPQPSTAQHSTFPHPPPAEWAHGFRKLQSLNLGDLGLNGTFPAAWQAKGSFPQLREL